MTDNKMTVYQCIAAVTADISEKGITKDKKNKMQGYNFRGIDDVYNALAPIIAKHGLNILPRVIDKEVAERTTKSGGALFYTTVEMEFDFISSHDNSQHTVKMYGEAMDSGDKSTNKAMSAAYKYACMQSFCIPTEGDNDADSTTHTVEAKPATHHMGTKPAIRASLTGEEFTMIQQGLKNATVETIENEKAKAKSVWPRANDAQRKSITKFVADAVARLEGGDNE